MPNRWALSRLDIVLVIVLVVGAAVVFLLGQTKASAEQEMARLDIRARAMQINLSEVEEGIDLEGLRQSLEQAQAVVVESPFPDETEAAAITDQILKYAKANNVAIVEWNSGYTSANLGDKEYSALSHTLSAVGDADAITRFVRALTRGSAALVVKSLDISAGGGAGDLWQMKLELLVYYK